MCYSLVISKEEDKKGSVHPQFSEMPQGSEAMKVQATELIRKQYEKAAVAKANGYLTGGGLELILIGQAEVMQNFAVELGILTREVADNLKKEYWDNRGKIATDIPGRFED